MTGLRLRLFVIAAVVAIAIFVRLGIWQLHRRDQRRNYNALVVARLKSPEVDFRDLPRDSSQAHLRRVRVTGTPDYDHELLWAARTLNGSPGVNFLTPVRVPGSDTAVLVNRGWVYSPDGSTVDENKWRERDTTFSGYAEPIPAIGGVPYSTRPRTMARFGYDAIRKALPYPVSPISIVMTGDSTSAADRVARLTTPPLDEGPHLNYAIQWFGFALVTLIGVGYIIKQSATTTSARDSTAGAHGSD
ncbi:MAG TPA: SURF1 family protein [Gemmatimonadaceae bacterium]